MDAPSDLANGLILTLLKVSGHQPVAAYRRTVVDKTEARRRFISSEADAWTAEQGTGRGTFAKDCERIRVRT